jgi:hypothetical protein
VSQARKSTVAKMNALGQGDQHVELHEGIMRAVDAIQDEKDRQVPWNCLSLPFDPAPRADLYQDVRLRRNGG